MQAGNHAEALGWFQAAVAKKPGLDKAWFRLGQCYLHMVEQEELLSIYESAGNEQRSGKRSDWLDMACRSLRQAVLLQPKHIAAWELLAKSYEISGQVEKALAAYLLLKQLQPDHPEAERFLGIVQEVQKGLAHDQIDDQLKLANRYFKMGLVSKALKTYDVAVKLEPGNQTALSEQATIYLQQNQYQKAARLYQQLIYHLPDLGNAHFNLGLCYFYQGQFYDAVDSYRNALQFEPDQPQNHFQLGLVYLVLGWNDQAMQAHKNLKQLDPHLASRLLDLILEFGIR